MRTNAVNYKVAIESDAAIDKIPVDCLCEKCFSTYSIEKTLKRRGKTVMQIAVATDQTRSDRACKEAIEYHVRFFVIYSDRVVTLESDSDATTDQSDHAKSEVAKHLDSAQKAFTMYNPKGDFDAMWETKVADARVLISHNVRII